MAAMLGALVPLACGRGGGGSEQDLSKLEIARYRFNLDDEHDVARIVAEVRNTGQRPVREAEITAILRGPGDEQRGLNRTVVKDIPPGRSKVFSLTVMTHGRERGVEFRITDPHASAQPED